MQNNQLKYIQTIKSCVGYKVLPTMGTESSKNLREMSQVELRFPIVRSKLSRKDQLKDADKKATKLMLKLGKGATIHPIYQYRNIRHVEC